MRSARTAAFGALKKRSNQPARHLTVKTIWWQPSQKTRAYKERNDLFRKLRAHLIEWPGAARPDGVSLASRQCAARGGVLRPGASCAGAKSFFREDKRACGARQEAIWLAPAVSSREDGKWTLQRSLASSSSSPPG